MTPSEAIAALLATDSTTTTLRESRYFGTTQPVPEGTSLPFQVCSELDSTFNHHLESNSNIVQRLMQLDHFAATEADVITLADAARNKLDVHVGIVTSGAKSLNVRSLRIQDETAESVIPDTAQASGVSRIRQEYLITFRL